MSQLGLEVKLCRYSSGNDVCCQCMRILICWHESCELIGIYVFIDITFQLMHGLKCMSRHVHIALIYM